VTPNILFVAPRVPLPPDIGWHQRMFHTLRALAAVGPVDLVCRRQSRDFAIDLGPLKRLCRSVRVLEALGRPEPTAPRTRGEAVHRFVLASRPTHLAESPDPELARQIEPLARAADLIWMVRLELSEWMPRYRDRMIVDIDDFESVKRAQLLTRRGFRPWSWLLWLDNQKLRRLERTAPRRYGLCVICSEVQRAYFPRRLHRRVLVVPNGFAPRLLSHPSRAGADTTIVFAGSMDYPPNVNAVSWFVRDIFPFILHRVPEARLLLVGHDHFDRLRPFLDGDRIVATGSVADAAPHVASSTVSIAPIRVGSGTRLKILEALALGVPVVSTTLGAEGLALAPDRDILLADQPGAFADGVVRLLTDRAAREALAAAGRAAVAAEYAWDRIEARLAEDVRSWLAGRQRVGVR
jgi:polysaccharide biosynthesis protein PslH